nr:hypothetical protein [Tanacetum cinerariifolium]
TDSEVVRLLAISSPPASPLSPWSSPPLQIPFLPLPPILSPPLPILSPTERSCVTQREIGYGITDSWDEIVETLQGAPVSTETELGGYVREFETRVRQDMDEIYTRLDDEQTERQLLAVRLNKEAWTRATDASDLVYGEVISLRTTVLGQISEIRGLQAADRRRQTVISELLRLDHRRSTETSELRTALQGQVTALQGQVTALQVQVATLQGQQGLVGDPTQLELPEEADGKARMSREAWTRATDASDLVHGKVISLRTTALGQISGNQRVAGR